MPTPLMDKLDELDQITITELRAEIERQRAFNYRLRAGLEWIVENADPKKCPMIVGRAKAALHE